MNKVKIIEKMLSIAPSLVQEGILLDTGCMSARCGDHFFITAKGASLSKLSEKEISLVNLLTLSTLNKIEPSSEAAIHAAIFTQREDISSIIHSTQLSVLTSSKAAKTVKPMLDDMAQIAGITVKISDCPLSANKKQLNQMVKHLKGRHALMLKDNGMLCCGNSLYDAHAVAMVMDKACKSFIETSFLGGGIKINKLESFLMRFVYLKKYSKQA